MNSRLQTIPFTNSQMLPFKPFKPAFQTMPFLMPNCLKPFCPKRAVNARN